MADLTDVIKAVGATDKASRFLGIDAVPPSVKQALGLLTGIANPYAYLASKGLGLLQDAATNQSPELQALKDVGQQNAEQNQVFQGMLRNQLREALPESVSQKIPEYQMPAPSLEQMGVDLQPFENQANNAPQNQTNEITPQYLEQMGFDNAPQQQQSYDFAQNYAQPVPSLMNSQPAAPDQNAQGSYMPETYSDMGYGAGEYDFRKGGIASLRRYL